MTFLRKIIEKLFKRSSASSEGKSAYCSFCRKSYSEAGPLVEGPDRVFICYGCLQIGLKMLQQESERRGKIWPPELDADSNVDKPLVETTRQQIKSMVDEIHQLSTANISPKTFYTEFLARVVACLAAIGGVVWLKSEDGALAPLTIQDVDKVGLDRTQLTNRGPALAKVLAGGENRMIPPDSPGIDESIGKKDTELNSTDYLLILALLRAGSRQIGLLEIFQRAGGRAALDRGYLRFVSQMCKTAEKFNAARGL